MTLRPARDADAGAVARIWHDGWRDGHEGNVPDELLAFRTLASFQLRASERVGDTVVAIVDRDVAGFVMVVDDEVEQVYVASEYRGTGVAGALLAEAERLVASNGHDEAWLAVVPGNSRARRFYERRGWTDDGLVDYPAATDAGPFQLTACRYAKRLTDATSIET
jgi:GNAT superfamily N-acetyltransferase